MADLESPQNIPLWISGSLAVLAGVVAAVERLAKVRLDWRGRPMKQHSNAEDSVPPPSDTAPLTRRGRPSLSTLSDQVPVTRAEFEARMAAVCDDVSRVEAKVDRTDDKVDQLTVEVVRGVGGINTRIERMRVRIASLFELYGGGSRRGGR
jgi:hypothetical protein